MGRVGAGREAARQPRRSDWPFAVGREAVRQLRRSVRLRPRNGDAKYFLALQLKGEALAQTYLQQMEALSRQQKLLASQLHDCIVPLLDRSA